MDKCGVSSVLAAVLMLTETGLVGLVASWSCEASSLTIRISTLHIITIPHHTPCIYLYLYLYPSIHLYISTHYIKGLNKVSRWFLRNLLFGAYYYILELELSPEMVKLIYKDLY